MLYGAASFRTAAPLVFPFTRMANFSITSRRMSVMTYLCRRSGDARTDNFAVIENTV